MLRAIQLSTILAPLVLTTACAHVRDAGQVDVSPPATTTLSASAARVGELRVLSRRVNLREPLRVDVEGRDVTVAFGVGPRSGVTMALDSRSLEAHRVIPYFHPESLEGAAAAFDPTSRTRVALLDGAVVECWNDLEANHLMVQVYDRGGAPRGDSFALSVFPMDLFGTPRAVTPDGRRVIVAFFATDAEGFSLVATSMEIAL